jgi:hypothetical protein
VSNLLVASLAKLRRFFADYRCACSSVGLATNMNVAYLHGMFSRDGYVCYVLTSPTFTSKSEFRQETL